MSGTGAARGSEADQKAHWADARAAALAFQGAAPDRAAWQLATAIPPLLLLLAAMHAAVALGHHWLALPLALPAAGFVVRAFALQHDCGHGSLFRTRRTNDAVGRLCSLLTWTPYGLWRRQHAGHHAQWNDLDGRDRGADIYSSCLTVAEFREMSRWRRLVHRAVRHPIVAQGLLPPVVFLVLYRFPFDSPRAWRRERHGVHLTNLALAAAYGGLGLALGFGAVAFVALAVMVPASVAGVWLFSVQHRFEGAVWARRAAWDPVVASLRGSSHLRLPQPLLWFTASLGLHHIHHLAPRVPNHRLAACQAAHPAFASVPALSLRAALRASRHALWDEAACRLVTFAEEASARRSAAPRAPRSAADGGPP